MPFNQSFLDENTLILLPAVVTELFRHHLPEEAALCLLSEQGLINYFIKTLLNEPARRGILGGGCAPSAPGPPFVLPSSPCEQQDKPKEAGSVLGFI